MAPSPRHLAVTLALLLALPLGVVASAARAQPADPPAGAQPDAGRTVPPNAPERRGPMMGGSGPRDGMMGMMREHGHHHHGPAQPDPAARFRIRRDGAEVDIRCAPQETMRACVEAAAALLDRLRGTAPPSPR